MVKKYITPNLIEYTSFLELLNDKETNSYIRKMQKAAMSLNDLFLCKKTLIVAEPGYGKTRLLKEIVDSAKKIGKHSIYIDLKKVNSGIAEQIQSEQTEGNIKLVNNADYVVCLDALDEVGNKDFLQTIDAIKYFIKRYSNVEIFISCRIAYLQKYSELFTDINFSCVRIEPFTMEQVDEYLESAGISKGEGEKLEEKLRFLGRDLILQTPRYLEMTVEMVSGIGANNLRELTKTDLFDTFIYKKLDIEIEKTEFPSQRKEIIKRMLEKIALVMEIYQINILKKEDLITLFDDIKSNLSASFLEQVPIEMLYERTVLKNNIDTVQFENTEFQEYLAAKEILRLGKLSQVVFDLTVDQEMQQILVSWFNALTFLVDLDISILKPLLDFGASRNEGLQNEEYHRLLTNVDVGRLKDSERREIFKSIFNYYQENLQWVPPDIARNLSYYFDCSLEAIFKNGASRESRNDYIKKSNIATIVGLIFDRNIFNSAQKQFWQRKLVQFAKNDNTSLQRQALFALGKLKSISSLEKVSFLRKSPDTLVVDAFVRACMDIDANDKFSIETFVIASKEKNIYARYGIYQVKNKEGIATLLDYFIGDTIFLVSFVEQEDIFKDKDNKVLENIENVYDSEIFNKLKAMVTSFFSETKYGYFNESKFLRDIILLLNKKDKNYIFSLLGEIRVNKKLQEKAFYIFSIFKFVLEKEQVKEFVDKASQIPSCKPLVFGTLLEVGALSRPNAKEVYEEGRQYFSEAYAHHESGRVVGPSKEQQIYSQFKIKLEPQPGYYNTDVFRFYYNNKEVLDKLMVSKDRGGLVLLAQNILKAFDPTKCEVTTPEKGTWRMSKMAHIFGDCLVASYHLSIDLSKFRKKIIGYIPFAQSDALKIIFALLQDLTKAEIDFLLSIYDGRRKDKLSAYMPGNLIDACGNYKIKEACPILKIFIQNAMFITFRLDALKVIVDVVPDRKYLGTVFAQYKDSQDDAYKLAERANAYLIERFQDADAIKWRLAQLILRAAPLPERLGGGTYSPDDLEHEMWTKEFAKPLLSLKNPNHKDKFFRILDKSFEIIKKGKEYHRYVTYLWEIICTYFNNLKETRTYKHIKDLELHMSKYASCEEGVNWFKYKLLELCRQYMAYVGKPQNIVDCIKKYNKLKEAQYLDISSTLDLVNLVENVVDNDIRRFVEDEGWYKLIEESEGKQESLLQKTIKTQLENSFLRKGFRGSEINVRREEQLLDDKRPDFLVSYGFIGPIPIEIKRTDNKEVLNKKLRRKYRTKLLQYIEGFKADYGMFILF